MKPFTVEDLYLHQKIASLHCIPARDEAVATVRAVDRENDGYVSHIWTFPFDGGPPRQMTRVGNSDTCPRWSPDGSLIALVSSRDGGAAQAHRIDFDGGEARACGKIDAGVSSLGWSPDGQSLYVAGIVKVNAEAGGRPLFLQGKEDERCPKYQAEEMFVSLYCAGSTPTETLVTAPPGGGGATRRFRTQRGMRTAERPPRTSSLVSTLP